MGDQNTAFILAAGFGTRLRPLTNVRPKPLMPICGVPMLNHALALVRAHGHRNVVVNAHHLWRQVAVWADGQDGVELSVELPDILGTGGGLRAALDRLADRFVVVNADVLCDVDLSGLLEAVPTDGAAMALRPAPEAAQIGPVEANAAGVVVRITSVVASDAGIPGTHFTGVHAMSRAAAARVPDQGLQCVVRTAYKALVPLGQVSAVCHTGVWFDVGTPAAYLQANLDVLDGVIRPPIDPWELGTRTEDGSWVGSGAKVLGGLQRSVVGAGATVPSDATVTDSVVWDGARVPPGVWTRVIVYGDGDVLVVEA